MHSLSLVAASWGYSSLRCAGFSLRWLLLLWSTGSRHAGFSSCGSRALEHRLSSCGARASLLRGTWDLPGPGLEPVSPALAGGFLTTAPPGKPCPAFRACSPLRRGERYTGIHSKQSAEDRRGGRGLPGGCGRGRGRWRGACRGKGLAGG